MRYSLQAIPGHKHRYPTVGDYFYNGLDEIAVRTSAMGDERYEALVLLHEFVELVLMRARGIPLRASDEFDKAFEAAGKPGEPGDDDECPYKEEHAVATHLESLLAKELGVDWDDYEAAQDRAFKQAEEDRDVQAKHDRLRLELIDRQAKERQAHEASLSSKTGER